MDRLAWPSGGGGGGGLTMSEEGGFDEVEESLRAAASCLCNWCDGGPEGLQLRAQGISAAPVLAG